MLLLRAHLYVDDCMCLGPPTVPILGNEHQIPAADGHFLYVSILFSFLFSLLRFTKLKAWRLKYCK